MSQPMLESLSEYELVRRAVDDPSAFGLLYQTYVDGIYRYCYRRLRNRESAEDATQTVFERAMAGLRRYRHEDSFRGWLFTIAHNVVVDHTRRARPAASFDDTFAVPDPHL